MGVNVRLVEPIQLKLIILEFVSPREKQGIFMSMRKLWFLGDVPINSGFRGIGELHLVDAFLEPRPRVIRESLALKWTNYLFRHVGHVEYL